MAASNTKECFRECVGKRVRGVLFDTLPHSGRELSRGTKTLIFDDGTGLTISASGAFWLEPAEEIERAIQNRRDELEANRKDIEDVITAAGGKAA